MDKKIEELAQFHYGKTVSIVGNGPTLVTMPGKVEHYHRYRLYTTDRAKGIQKDINEYEQPRAVVRRLANHPNPLWTVNGGWTYHPESNVGFLMDDHRFHRAETHPQPEWYDNQMKIAKIPIITSMPYPEYPSLTPYPLKEVIKKFRTKYFGESIDYMVALAGLFEVKKVVFYGCDYQLHDRFPGERAGTEYWIGRLEGIGIECDASPSQNLMKPSQWELQYHPQFYGYGRDNFPYTDDEINAFMRGEDYAERKVG